MSQPQSIAATEEYRREYDRLKRLGLPTVGLADRMRNGEHTVHFVPAERRHRIERAFARGNTASQVMMELNVSYEDVWTVRRGME